MVFPPYLLLSFQEVDFQSLYSKNSFQISYLRLYRPSYTFSHSQALSLKHVTCYLLNFESYKVFFLQYLIPPA